MSSPTTTLSQKRNINNTLQLNNHVDLSFRVSLNKNSNHLSLVSYDIWLELAATVHGFELLDWNIQDRYRLYQILINEAC